MAVCRKIKQLPVLQVLAQCQQSIICLVTHIFTTAACMIVNPRWNMPRVLSPLNNPFALVSALTASLCFHSRQNNCKDSTLNIQ